ncbi:MAG: glycosyltransferase [Candidatus Rokubacteria bacterium]|nr:glycosyltransferase [Candidatus Rokubacteria bacterium]
MADPALVSVILTCYNGERWIAETIRSVLAQSHTEHELIVINDGSADRSGEIVRSFNDPRLRYVEQPNRGIPGARNRGLMEAKGEAICILDQDDLWHPDKLALQVSRLSHDPQVGAVYTNAEHIDATGRIIGRRFDGPQPEGWLLERFLRHGVAVPIMTTMIRHECFKKVGGFDERLYGCDDYELLVRLAAEFRFSYLPLPLASLRYHSRNAWQDGRMVLDRLIVAAELAVRFPQHASLVRRYRASAHYHHGLHLLAKCEPRRARAEFGHAIRNCRSFWRAYVLWLQTLRPNGGRREGRS